MTDSLDDLKRRAYSSDSVDALHAREQLALLERTQERESTEAAEPMAPIPELPRFATVPWWAVAAVGVVTAVAITAGTVAAFTPVSPQELFDREPTALDESISPFASEDAIEGSVRWLGATQDYEVFVYLKAPDDVCLSATQTNLTSWACVTREQFAESGLFLKLSQTVNAVPGYLTISWGPDGTAHFDWAQGN